jgi:3-oxoacyl-[acyl-carrier protein] reductase
MESSSQRIVWITGASSGIGAALVDAFAARGDYVVASARSESGLKEICKKVGESGGACDSFPCDVSDEHAVHETVKRIIARCERIDILINNAGITSFAEFKETSSAEFDKIIHTNLRGPFLTTRAALVPMLERHTGLVINILSYVVKQVYTKSAAYAASKAGTAAMMDVLRAEVRRQGIGIVNVFPGAVSTPMWRAEQRERFHGQMLTAEHVAHAIVALSLQSPELMAEEIVLRPRDGDLHQ